MQPPFPPLEPTPARVDLPDARRANRDGLVALSRTLPPGLAVGSLFAGESMFHRRTGASKVAFARMVERLRLRKFRLFDVQVMSPHLSTLGCVELSRDEYLRIVERCVRDSIPF